MGSFPARARMRAGRCMHGWCWSIGWARRTRSALDESATEREAVELLLSEQERLAGRGARELLALAVIPSTHGASAPG